MIERGQLYVFFATLKNVVTAHLFLEKQKYIFWLTNFMSLTSFYTPWKHKKTRGFLMLAGGIERDQWHELGNNKQNNIECIFEQSRYP